MSDDTKAAEIPALGEGYSHARKAYGLVSALLMVWELIGVELQPAPIQNFNVILKSPQAAPYVLIVLILYFGFRVTVEWYQNDIRRRRLHASRIDFTVAHVIAAAALALYGFQTLSQIQVANTISQDGFFLFVAPVVCGGISRLLIAERDKLRDWRQNWFHNCVYLLATLAALTIAIWIVLSAVTQWKLREIAISLLCLLFGYFYIQVLNRINNSASRE